MAKAKPTPKDSISQRARQVSAFAACLNAASATLNPEQLRTSLGMLESMTAEIAGLVDRPRPVTTAKPKATAARRGRPPKARTNGAAHQAGGAQ